MERARAALKVAKSVIRFAKFKKVVANKKADETALQIEHIRSALKMSQSTLKKKAADASVEKAANANEEKFSWEAQKKYWDQEASKNPIDKMEAMAKETADK